MNAPDALFRTADSFLLAPHELQPSQLDRVFGAMLAGRLDYADLYF